MLGKKTSERGRNPLVWLAPNVLELAHYLSKTIVRLKRILILIYLGLTTRTTETVTDKDIPLFGAKFCSVNRKRRTFALSRTRKLKFLCMTCYSNLGVGDHNSKLPNAMVKSLPPRRDFSLAARPCLSINSRQRDISRER